jgi:predicted nucleic acid-binding Zn ribbon protein
MIEQAIYGWQGTGKYRFLARSPGFRDDWLAEAERLCAGFGERPAGIACPGCVFARPFGRHHVAIVQAADQGADDTGQPGALSFYLLILSRLLYEELGGDPFFIAEQFPPPWLARGELPSLTWSGGMPPPRTVAMLQKILNVPYSATLLGGAQILLDGGRLVFERSAPDAAILRSLWALLPTSERAKLWPASFAFRNAHQFDAVVTPRATETEYEHYITEEKAGDYPEGRYECNLQSAIETGDQEEIDALLNYNRSRRLRLIVVLFLIVVLLSAAMSVLLSGPRPAPPTAATVKSP